jgi:hypothetical protein
MAERFTLTQRVLEGDLVDRSPQTWLMHYRLEMDSIGHVTRFAVEQRPPASDSSAPSTLTGTRTTTGFDLTVRDGDSVRKQSVAAPAGALPIFARSIGLYEVITARFRRERIDSITVPMFELDPAQPTERVARRLGPDSVGIHVIFPRGEHARVDATGRILGVSGLATSYKWLTERVPDFDILALARAFANQDVKGKAFGNYSSRDTVSAVVDGAHITIDYGRPSKRGRVVFGGLVPWGEVWRTGADLATHLTVDRAVKLNGLMVPAGTYTLYTLPSPTGWKLIVNRRVGQSGLVYDQSADLGRAEMRTTLLPSVTERLTITVQQRPAAGGVLRILWDDLSAEAALIVLP